MKRIQYLIILITAVILMANIAIPPKPASAFLGIGDFGVTVDLVQEYIKRVSNVAAHTLARRTISNLVQSTVSWANNGFDGNPVYVQNPKQFFLNSTNQTAESFLKQVGNGKLGFLCSPFQKQIQLSLVYYYYQPQNQALQCTWTGIGGNLQNFYSDFSQGGWDGWFSLTQVPTNNVYGAGVTAQLELSKQIQQTLGLKKNEYDKNQGFLDIPGDCLVKNPDQAFIDAINRGEKNYGEDFDIIDEDVTPHDTLENDFVGGVVMYNPNKAAGDCIYHDAVKTPGTVIQNEITKTLGTQVDQLINAHDWDEVVAALINGLQKRIFNSKSDGGLFSNKPTDGIATGNEPPGVTYGGPGTENCTKTGTNASSTITCTNPSGTNGTDGTNGTPGQQTPSNAALTCQPSTPVVGINQPVTWSTNVTSPTATFVWKGALLSSTAREVTLSYTKPDTYNASVTVSDNGNVTTANCGTVLVTSTPPPVVTCAPFDNTRRVPFGGSAGWTATITGGSGAITSAFWIDTSYNYNGEPFSDNDISKTGSTTVVQTAVTYTQEGKRTASVVVQDADKQFPAITAACTDYVLVGNKLTTDQ